MRIGRKPESSGTQRVPATLCASLLLLAGGGIERASRDPSFLEGQADDNPIDDTCDAFDVQARRHCNLLLVKRVHFAS